MSPSPADVAPMITMWSLTRLGSTLPVNTSIAETYRSDDSGRACNQTRPSAEVGRNAAPPRAMPAMPGVSCRPACFLDTTRAVKVSEPKYTRKASSPRLGYSAPCSKLTRGKERRIPSWSGTMVTTPAPVAVAANGCRKPTPPGHSLNQSVASPPSVSTCVLGGGGCFGG